MGFPIARLVGRAALIGAMIAGGMLMAGIAQAQAQTTASLTPAAPPSPIAPAPDGGGQPTLADRQAELVAASGGPASVQHLVMAAPERPAVEERADDVEDSAPDPSAALNAAEAARGGGVPLSPATAPASVPAAAPQ